MAAKKQFDAASPNLWASVITFILSVGALGGINWGVNPELLGDKLTTTLTGGGLWAVAGIAFTNIVTPIYYVIKNKAFRLSLRSTNFWQQVITFVLSLGVTFGIAFQPEAAGDIVAAVAAKDWGLLFTIAVPAFFTPLIRFIRDRIQKPEPTA